MEASDSPPPQPGDSDRDSSVNSSRTISARVRRPQTGRLIRLCAKELREILRDRRTIITLVLMPLLVYPILTLTFNTFLFTSFQAPEEVQPVVVFESEEAFEGFQVWYSLWSEQLEGAIPLDPETGEPTLEFAQTPDVRKAVGDGDAHLAVVVKPSQTPPTGKIGPNLPRIDVELIYREGSVYGAEAVKYFERRLASLNVAFDREELSTSLPVRNQRQVIKTESGMAFSFASFVPLMLILMTITGAVYPAIDLTAGERERGTMEALVAAPIPRVGLLLAKYVAVVIVAILTATANLVAMMITLASSQLGELLFGDGGISFTAMAQVYSLMILFAAFFSAILLVITSFARSFKEAQAYLIPLMLLSLGPGIISLMPDIKMTPMISVVPLLNMVLLARDTIQDNVNPILATAAVVSTFVYAVASISFAARIFGTDAILYGSEASWKDLFRRPEESTGKSSIAGALICLALLFPLQFVAASLASRLASSGPKFDLEIKAPQEIVYRSDSESQILVEGLPDAASLNVGDQIGRNEWRVRGEDLEELRLISTQTFSKPATIGFTVLNSQGEKPPGSTLYLSVSVEKLAEGIVVNSKTISIQLIINALLTVALFVGVPMISARWQAVRTIDGFRLWRPRWGVLPGVILLGVSLWPFAHEIVVLGMQLGIGSIEDKMSSIEHLIAEFQTVSPILIILCLAVAPGVCEEFFFRGFLMQSLMGRVKPWQSILISAVCFGAFHLIGSGVLSLERLLPSTFLGLFLGWVCYRTGSVIPGMIMHTFNNGFLLMLSYYRDALIEQGWNVGDQAHLPWAWLLSATLIAATGLAIVWFFGRPVVDKEQELQPTD